METIILVLIYLIMIIYVNVKYNIDEIGIADLGEKEFIKPVYIKKKRRTGICILLEITIFIVLFMMIIDNPQFINIFLLIILIVCCIYGTGNIKGE